MPGFNYTPLETARSIRLIQLEPQPFSSNAPCWCKFIHKSLDDSFEYDALSYTWGDGAVQRTISCEDGQELKVGINLHSALTALRSFEMRSSRLLWIDALCINQNDNEERNQQVSLMADIYSKAGQRAEEANLGTFNLEYDKHYLEVGLPVPTSPEWVAFDNKFFYRDWFTRRWVAQELALAKEPYVIISPMMIPWSMLVSVAKLCNDCLRRIPVHGTNPVVMENIAAEVKKSGRSSNLLSLLRRTSFLNCTNPKDKLYALLGIAHPAFLKSFAPNYSMSTVEVYENFATAMILADKRSLTILNMVSQLPPELHPTEAEGLSSWVPDWSSAYGLSNYLTSIDAPPYNSSKDSSPQPLIAGSILIVEGMTADEVMEVGPPLMPYVALDGAILPPKRLMSEPYWTEFVRHVWSFAHNTEETNEASKYRIDTHEETAEKYIRHAKRYSTLRRLITTSNKKIGLAPFMTEKGDKICLFYGGQTPFILRPKQGRLWRLIGECYISGLMNGEGFDEEAPRMMEVLEKDGHWAPAKYFIE
ncbi:uncharacterized protein PAC_20150 [Phialocephala subalpina]|uniref:Heterokaryon incompatibility domain-containing protein n=1 Tax=Phialocephala subalpina TaxID=576137 RepID=A0A1L7XYZ8_9HELO|nr:uncharacterized protein PAC_20150 [Phialocephala subalpina]